MGMSDQPSLFDPVEGHRRKEEGMRQAEQAPDVQTWKRWFRIVLEEFADLGQPFTSEDIIEQIGLPRRNVQTNANNAVGAMISGAARRKVIRKTGRHRLSRRPSSHGAELTEWVGGR